MSSSGTSVDELNKLKKEIGEKNKRIAELEGKDIPKPPLRPNMENQFRLQSSLPSQIGKTETFDFSKDKLYDHLKVKTSNVDNEIIYTLNTSADLSYNKDIEIPKIFNSDIINDCLTKYDYSKCIKLINDKSLKIVNDTPVSDLIKSIKGMNVYKIYNYLRDFGFGTKLSKDPYPSPPNSNLTVRLCESVDEYLNRYMNASNSTIQRVLNEIAGNASTSTGTLPLNNSTNSNTSQDQQGDKLNNNPEQFKDLITAIKGSIEMRKLLSIFVAYVNCFPNLFDPSYQYPNNRSSDLPSGKYSLPLEIFKYEDLYKHIGDTVKSNQTKNLVRNRNYVVNSFGNKPSMNQLNVGLLQTPFPNHFGMMLPINGGKSLESQGYSMSGGNIISVSHHPFLSVREQKSNNNNLETNLKQYHGKSSDTLNALLDNITRSVHSFTQGKVTLKDVTTNKIKDIIKSVSNAEDEAVKELTRYMEIMNVIKNTRGTINPLELPKEEQDRVIEAYKNYSENTNKAIKGTNKVLSTLDAILKAIENFGTSSSNTNNNTDNLLPKFT